ncbi:serine protease grass [Drosophila eugracilis]|uniref:serine protease grass n=1 Tax=Drosophila eugracilis TaxID=29029 RepID=UPI0007E7A04D|nr:serine protease grass [Drosophila eugracilis]
MRPAIALLTLLAILSFGKLGFTQLLEPKCIPSYATRVIGGRSARRSPWMAYLIRNNAFACGGSLIAYRFVLTAGHCTQIPDNNLYVRLGEYDSSRTSDGRTAEYRVISTFRHEKYINFEHDDIAVLKLDRTVIYNDKIRPICIFLNPGMQSFVDRLQDFTLTGWGQTATYYQMPTTLQEMSLRRVDRYFCGAKSNTICCSNPSQFACFGDSGSPLGATMRYGRGYIYAQFGVTSSVTGNCDGYSTYVDVTSYLPWLLTTLRRNWL